MKDSILENRIHNNFRKPTSSNKISNIASKEDFILKSESHRLELRKNQIDEHFMKKRGIIKINKSLDLIDITSLNILDEYKIDRDLLFLNVRVI